MYLFVLGVVFGMGLLQAYKSVAKTIQLRGIRKRHEVELEIQRRVNERTSGWGSVETGIGTTADFAQRNNRRPAGPTHPSHSIPEMTW